MQERKIELGSQEISNTLKKQILQYKKLQETFAKRFSQDSKTQFYILSVKWLMETICFLRKDYSQQNNMQVIWKNHTSKNQ